MAWWSACMLAMSAWAQADVQVIAAGSNWRYDAGGPLDPSWNTSGYDDSTWLMGPAQLGFGEEDQGRTVLPNPVAPYTTLYLRRPFTVDPTGLDTLVFELLVDDGALVWLNGVELYRDNLPPGPIDALTPALVDIDGSDEHRFVTVRLPATDLLSGDNLLAVEVHQSAPDSDDLSFDLALTATDGGLRLQRAPYLQQPTPTSMVVRFRTDAAVAGTVWLGPSPNALDRIVSGPVGFDHEILVDGLEPDSTTYYAVGGPGEPLAGGDTEHRIHTMPVVGEPHQLRIWAIGDAGTATPAQDAVYQAYGNFTDRDTDLWLMLGDNAYDDGTDAQYQKAVFDVYPSLLASSPVWPTIGNHDGHTAKADGMIGPYFDIFTLPIAAEAGGVPSGTEAYYSFDVANVHFVVLDSYSSDISAGAAQWTWLEEDLLSADADWLVAMWHHPPYTHGTHNSDFELNEILVRAAALPLLEAHGVDLVLSGHSHGYERSMLVDGHYGSSTTFTASNIVNGGLGREDGGGAYLKPLGLTAHDGAVFVVNGSSGKTGLGAYDHPVHLIGLPTLGSFVLDIDGDRLDGQFIDSTGQVVDHFSVIKVPGYDVPDTRSVGRNLGCGCQSAPLGWSGSGLLILLALLAAGRARAHPTATSELERVDAALAQAPCDWELWQKRARVQADDGAFQDALDDLEVASLCHPFDPQIDAARGPILLALGRTDEAVQALELAAVLHPQADWIHADLAHALEAAGACDRAAASWSRHHLTAARTSPDTWLGWARALACADRADEAVAVLDAGIDTLGPIPGLERERVELLVSLGRHEQALAHLRALTARYPRSPTWPALARRIEGARAR